MAAVYDSDTRKVGSKAGRVEVRDLEQMDTDCEGGCFDMAILAVPTVAAQQVTDRLVDLGVRSILNFAPVRVHVPAKVTVRQVDLSMELQVLSYYGSKP